MSTLKLDESIARSLFAKDMEERLKRQLAVTERQRDELLTALKSILATDFLKNDSGVRQASPVRWNRALEIASAAIEKAEDR